jgi:NAD(P)-dependent dehydrogenase (short-subunit alcohol dehydrogenase family)
MTRAVVVTGAGSGIGHAVTQHLLAQGFTVCACDVAPGLLSSIHHQALSVTELDVRHKPSLDAAMQRFLDSAGRIDGLVACAGIYKTMPFLTLDEATWDATFDINLKGAFFSCQAVLPVMRRQHGGSIVLFSSSLARQGAVRGAHYAATKGGILGFARSLALDVARDGVRVNVISPGVTDTAMPREHATDADLEATAKKIPLGRIGRPQDMAEAALFLLADDSAFVTGQDIRVNGGALIF